MANSKYEYVRLFEQPDTLLANTWIVVRIDGRGFSKLTTKYKFVKPNDRNALDLMNAAAVAVMKELPDLVLAYGNSDEYSFVFHKDCALFERRASKLTTTITSTFTSYYVFLWTQYFPDKPLTAPLPSFDGRAVCYPSDFNLRDYMSWRQVDCHINNLYNTTFWTLVQQGGMGAREAEQKLSGTYSADKNEILFREFGINYNNEPACFKKGTVLYRDFYPTSADKPEASATETQVIQPASSAAETNETYNRHSRRAVKKSIPSLPQKAPSPVPADRGPTFLSAASTPSPPSSPEAMSKPTVPNPLRSNPVDSRTKFYPPVTMPLSPPSTGTSPMEKVYITSGLAKQPLPSLVPLPLSPPVLKPSTKPPLSLNAPNPTTRNNFSPTTSTHDFPAAYPISGYNHGTVTGSPRFVSHSASASVPMTDSLHTIQGSESKPRSPSQPQLPTYFAEGSSHQPLAIPLRISSIPANSKPRKLSLPNQQSLSTRKGRSSSEEKANIMTSAQLAGSTTPRRVSPPLRTNKALPSPPMTLTEEMKNRGKIMNSNSPQDTCKYSGQVWPGEDVVHPGIAELPATEEPSTSKNLPYTTDIQPTAPLKDSPRSRGSKSTFSVPPPPTAAAAAAVVQPDTRTSSQTTAAASGKSKMTEFGGWAAGTEMQNRRPVPQSRTQRDKERKKRSKARVLVEHVDLIRDEFWEKRPWILSGKIG
ncbi:tRNAHis guanylyltransferase-domain-containing protein [Ampelomyces quisqualis]|uniref:tRNA(His) guanylyltransferase n=1 Tax=Ampelomyces quisqualis TaxID=50730 RepID=A0A6A5QFY0_AMPQU|nr:tRNAHis guanylyltransferase-domain-containing protein [Ampelomyces quisqualis]